jgi:single-strand DNA-binding protein
MSTTIVGNLVRDPELKFTNNGKAYAQFSVAVTKKKGEEEYTSYFDCTVWNTQAENLANSLHKGDRVVVFGTLNQDRFEKDGQKRSAVNLNVEAVGPELRFATVVVTKTTSHGPKPETKQESFASDPF